jgi:ATP-dependent helicase/nuclease subunit A
VLYVALTRPRDRLYICGFQTKVGRGREDGCWYDLVEAAMQSLGATSVRLGETTIHRLGSAPAVIVDAAKVDRSDTPLPAWVRTAAASERVSRPINPSDAVRSSRPTAISAARKIEIGPALERGRAIHRLLELLAPLDREAWAAKAQALAASLVEDQAAAVAAAAEALRARADPAFARLFAPGSQGEVTLRGCIVWQGKQVDLVARIDRMLVEPKRVLIVEFKTDRTVPETPEQVSQGYVTQLALYARAAAALFPNRDVECAVLWTAAPRLDAISSKKLEAAEGALDPLWGPS